MIDLIIRIVKELRKDKILLALVIGMIVTVIIGITVILPKSRTDTKKEDDTEEIKTADNVFTDDAFDNIEFRYVNYGEYGNCLLFITNNNDFQVNISGTITKTDENGVDSYASDTLDVNIGPHTTNVYTSTNPNTSSGKKNNLKINYDPSELEIGPVEGSDKTGKNSKKVLRQEDVELNINYKIQNDSGYPLITANNKSKDNLSCQGYIIFYTDSSKSVIASVENFDLGTLEAEKETRKYLSHYFTDNEDKNSYDIYFNTCNVVEESTVF